MKKSLLISAAIAIGSVAAALFIKRRRDAKASRAANVFVKKSFHLTDVFSKAKEAQQHIS